MRLKGSRSHKWEKWQCHLPDIIFYLQFNGGHSSECPGHRLSPEPEELPARAPELGGHQAVEDEVGGAVDQDDDLEDLSEGNITRVEKLSAKDCGEHSENSL